MENSLFVSLLNKIWKIYVSIEGRLITLFRGSILFTLAAGILDKLRADFKYSFLYRFGNLNNTTDFFGTSNITRRFMSFSVRLAKRATGLFGDSQPAFLAAALRSKFNIAPIRAGSVVLAVSVLTNILLSIMFNREMAFASWILNGLLLLLGLAGFSCDAGWKDIVKSSVILSKILK